MSAAHQVDEDCASTRRALRINSMSTAHQVDEHCAMGRRALHTKSTSTAHQVELPVPDDAEHVTPCGRTRGTMWAMCASWRFVRVLASGAKSACLQRMRQRPLLKLDLLFAAVVASVLAGCGGSVATTPPEGEKPFDLNVCDGGVYYPARGLKLVGYDYVALKEGDFSATTPARLLDEEGKACATAKDAAKCLEAVAAATSTTGFGAGFDFPGLKFLVTTKADEVKVWNSIDLVKTLFAPVDNAKKAAFLATTQFHSIDCSVPNARKGAGGIELATKTGSGCGDGDDIKRNVTNVSTDGTLSVLSFVVIKKGDPGCAIGRRPAGLVSDQTLQGRSTTVCGTFLADIARLEAASVPAFARLATDLCRLGAPRRLVQSARRSRREEVRHARTMARLSRRFGGVSRSPTVAVVAPRPIEVIAVENAVEGCIRETFGALIAQFQAQTATNPRLRAAMNRIARDEARHAALSWQIHVWAGGRLTADGRAQVNLAMQSALETLRLEVAAGSTSLVGDAKGELGMPSPAQAVALLDGLFSSAIG